MRLPFLATLICLATLSACGPANPQEPVAAAPPAPPLPASGKVHNKLPIAADSSQHYALYLPTTFAPGKHLPIVLFFDLQGQGGIPVRRYAPIAERHGFILAGSLSSKNGQEFRIGKSIHNKLWAEMLNKFSPDTARVVLAGFSGGARLVGALAKGGERANTVICVGGAYDLRSGDPFHFVGMAGQDDFNFREVMTLDQAIGPEQSHLFLPFEGGHEWPPVSVMEQAFAFIRLRQMAEKLCPEDAALIDSTRAAALREAGGKGTLARWRALQRGCDFLQGLRGGDSLCITAKELSTRQEVVDEAAQQQRDFKLEQEINLRFNGHFGDWTLDTWRRELAPTLRAAQPDTRAARPYRRALNLLSLLCYMNCMGAMADPNAAPAADRLISVYRLIDPDNAEHAVMRAQWLARKGELPTAMKSLEEAEKLGFRDAARLRAATEFQPLAQDTAYQAMLSRLDALPEPQ